MLGGVAATFDRWAITRRWTTGGRYCCFAASYLLFFQTMNTRADREGADVLHGPGIRVEMPPMQDPVMQLTLTVTEDELFHILFFGTANEPRGRLLRATIERGWRFFDPVRAEYVPPYHDPDDDDDDDDRRFGSDDDDD
jgi:hypothetical protein